MNETMHVAATRPAVPEEIAIGAMIPPAVRVPIIAVRVKVNGPGANFSEAQMLVFAVLARSGSAALRNYAALRMNRGDVPAGDDDWV